MLFSNHNKSLLRRQPGATANHYVYATLQAPSDAGIDQVLCVARIGATLSAALQMADHL